MTRIDQMITDALAQSRDTVVHQFASEVVRLRGENADLKRGGVVVQELTESMLDLACGPELPRMFGPDAIKYGLRDSARRWYRKGWKDLASRLRTIPADRVLGEGVVALRRFAERCAQRDHQPDEHIGCAKCVACEAEDALRTHQEGVNHD